MDKPFNFPVPEIAWNAILPVILVAVSGIVALLVEMFRRKGDNPLTSIVSLAGLLAAAMILARQLGDQLDTAAGMVTVDRVSAILQLSIVAVTALVILFSGGYLSDKRISFGEFYPLLLWSSTGAMIMCGTENLLMIFLGLEIMSVAIYVMAGMSRREEKSEESAMKYFLLGSFAGGFLLFGISFFYGATGSLQLDTLPFALANGDPSVRAMAIFSISLMLVGLGFKTSLVPFHQWTPDVYQGAPTNVAGFMATVSKIGAFAALYRVLTSFSVLQSVWRLPLEIVALLTMTVGNLIALTQSDVKRMLGYSSIAQAGYVLVALLAGASGRSAGYSAIFYLVGYSVMTIGAFAVVSIAAGNGREATRLDDLRGLWRRSPLAAIALAICMFSLAGFPLTVGFTGKLVIFIDTVQAGMAPLAIALAVNSVISLAYYLRIAYAGFQSDELGAENSLGRLTPGLAGACIICIAGVIGGGLFLNPLLLFLRTNH